MLDIINFKLKLSKEEIEEFDALTKRKEMLEKAYAAGSS
jgi:hypothetical protein